MAPPCLMPSLVVVPRSRSWSMPASLAAPARSRGSMLHGTSASVFRFEKSNVQWFSIELTESNNEVDSTVMRISICAITCRMCHVDPLQSAGGSRINKFPIATQLRSFFPDVLNHSEQIHQIFPFVPSYVHLWCQESVKRFDAYDFHSRGELFGCILDAVTKYI